MSDIKPGDLVVKVRGGVCGTLVNIGIPFFVESIDFDEWLCAQCGGFHKGGYVNAKDASFTGAPLFSVIKINPPSQDDSVTTDINNKVTA